MVRWYSCSTLHEGLKYFILLITLSISHCHPDIYKIRPSGSRVIQPYSCHDPTTKETGVCMFSWNCQRSNGTHLTYCMDRFYFGSCCRLPPGVYVATPPSIETNEVTEVQNYKQKPSTLRSTVRPTTSVAPIDAKYSVTYNKLSSSTSRPALKPFKTPATTEFPPGLVTWRPHLASASTPKPIKAKPTKLFSTKPLFASSTEESESSDKNRFKTSQATTREPTSTTSRRRTRPTRPYGSTSKRRTRPTKPHPGKSTVSSQNVSRRKTRPTRPYSTPTTPKIQISTQRSTIGTWSNILEGSTSPIAITRRTTVATKITKPTTRSTPTTRITKPTTRSTPSLSKTSSAETRVTQRSTRPTKPPQNPSTRPKPSTTRSPKPTKQSSTTTYTKASTLRTKPTAISTLGSTIEIITFPPFPGITRKTTKTTESPTTTPKIRRTSLRPKPTTPAITSTSKLTTNSPIDEPTTTQKIIPGMEYTKDVTDAQASTTEDILTTTDAGDELIPATINPMLALTTKPREDTTERGFTMTNFKQNEQNSVVYRPQILYDANGHEIVRQEDVVVEGVSKINNTDTLPNNTSFSDESDLLTVNLVSNLQTFPIEDVSSSKPLEYSTTTTESTASDVAEFLTKSSILDLSVKKKVSKPATKSTPSDMETTAYVSPGQTMSSTTLKSVEELIEITTSSDITYNENMTIIDDNTNKTVTQAVTEKVTVNLNSENFVSLERDWSDASSMQTSSNWNDEPSMSAITNAESYDPHESESVSNIISTSSKDMEVYETTPSLISTFETNGTELQPDVNSAITYSPFENTYTEYNNIPSITNTNQVKPQTESALFSLMFGTQTTTYDTMNNNTNEFEHNKTEYFSTSSPISDESVNTDNAGTTLNVHFNTGNNSEEYIYDIYDYYDDLYEDYNFQYNVSTDETPVSLIPIESNNVDISTEETVIDNIQALNSVNDSNKENVVTTVNTLKPVSNLTSHKNKIKPIFPFIPHEVKLPPNKTNPFIGAINRLPTPLPLVENNQNSLISTLLDDFSPGEFETKSTHSSFTESENDDSYFTYLNFENSEANTPLIAIDNHRPLLDNQYDGVKNNNYLSKPLTTTTDEMHEQTFSFVSFDKTTYSTTVPTVSKHKTKPQMSQVNKDSTTNVNSIVQDIKETTNIIHPTVKYPFPTVHMKDTTVSPLNTEISNDILDSNPSSPSEIVTGEISSKVTVVSTDSEEKLGETSYQTTSNAATNSSEGSTSEWTTNYSSTTTSKDTPTSTTNFISSLPQDTTLTETVSNDLESSKTDLIPTSTIWLDKTETETTADTSTSFPTTTEIDLESADYREVCGKPRPGPVGRIVGGGNSYFGEWPWVVSLRQWKKNAFLHKCGATLLNEFWAITAAHCVENVPLTDILLRLGEYDISNENEPLPFVERRVQIVASHPQFDRRTFEYDLALLRFYEPVTFQKNILPICVPSGNNSYVGKYATVTGWGRLYEDGPLPDVIQEVSLPIITNKLCETMYRKAGFVEDIPDIFICAGYADGGKDSCEGDSGGPMVLQEDDGRWVLAGVISWGIGCALPNQPGVYTRITKFAEWINQIIIF